MTALAIGTMLIGMVLGTRFRVVILPPVIVAGSAALAFYAMLTGVSTWNAMQFIIVFVTVLQLGYACTALVVASVFHGGEKDDSAGEKSETVRLVWKRSPVRHDLN
ncbi:hypothetical protein [Bradyrhizobium symbiodeficiens]|uniref:Uncharacterized protein n=1 Tax=Bradyrhizobium symbiodeficiens TaxID=1404367 RepID=A0A6G8ZZ67_9BRAD|nr:hypothetical protein [Bradyrhizobium symbiodeficiens]QIP05512.1 hypothetical protein HAV00_04255 [Bradyrhizobium symbiodeficiens]